MSLFELLKRPEIHYNDIKPLFENEYSDEVLQQAEISIKYEGYIKKAEKQATKMIKIDDKIIPDNINYDHISNLALEARDKLKKHQPKNTWSSFQNKWCESFRYLRVTCLYTNTQMKQFLEPLGITLTEEQLNQFKTYYEFLVTENKKYNLRIR